MFERPSDFSYMYSHNSYILSFSVDGKKQEIMGLKSLDEVRSAIQKLTGPQKIKRPVYSGTCECMYKNWRYYEEEQESIIFKVCNVCNKPLDREVLKHFNSDFSLDDFISGG